MRLAAALAVCSVAGIAAAQAAQNGVVELRDNQWVVTVRVAQDRADRPEGGMSLRMASTIAARKIIEFACKLTPGAGEKVSARLRGLTTLGSSNTVDWAEVTMSAPVQTLQCKLEKAATRSGALTEPESPGVTPDAAVVREVRTEY